MATSVQVMKHVLHSLGCIILYRKDIRRSDPNFHATETANLQGMQQASSNGISPSARRGACLVLRLVARLEVDVHEAPLHVLNGLNLQFENVQLKSRMMNSLSDRYVS